uniref:Ectonucleoside triphosphate diphosphohydrolase 8 n=1 Tax=Strix occidentalis caurina TaxID=311401 RepID=A0A8D0EGE6_STROC
MQAEEIQPGHLEIGCGKPPLKLASHALSLLCSAMVQLAYGMVFDAGSSHTSLFVYEWDSDKENDTGVVSQNLSCDVQGQGISSYANDPAKAGDSLRECLNKAMKVVPAGKQRDVPAYLGATAGMRLLREQNSSAADQVLAEVTKTMQEYPVAFKGAQILTGEEEGAYGWITINYLLDSFTKVGEGEGSGASPNIFGALDLGGASTQISFMPESSVMNWNETSKFTLYGYNYNIYTHSYLCYGQNEMLKRLESSSSTRVDHPCYPKDYNETISLSSFRTSPCTNQSDPRLILGDRNVTLEGRGNASGCLAAIKKLFNFSACGQRQDCTFDGVYQPPVRGQFIVRQIPSSHLRGRACPRVQWCPCVSPGTRLPKYCANANYILTLLLDAYKFNETSWNNIFFRMKVGSADVGWTLGYMLNLTNMIPAEPPTRVKGHVPSLWAAAITFIILTLALGFAALLLLLWCLPGDNIVPPAEGLDTVVSV